MRDVGAVTRHAGSNMFSLQKFFSKDSQFFELLEASAEECRASVRALTPIVGSSEPLTMDQFIATRRKDKQITAAITELICRVSVTALDREDIEALSSVLYKIPKTAEKFAERYIISVGDLRDVSFSAQLKLVEEAVETLALMVKELRRDAPVEKITALNAKLQRLEGDADKLMLDLLKDLYSRRHDSLKAIQLKDLYELLEKLVDRCRDAGNVISQIMLKNG